MTGNLKDIFEAPRLRVFAVGMTVALTIGAQGCAAGAAPTTSSSASPSSSPTRCGTTSGRGCAPTSRRVDLARPVFSNPTRITNPLFPISNLHSAVLLGTVDGLPFRAETTLLPHIKTINWNGQRIRALTSQYTAYLDGRLQEVALDWYAQADDGAAWYLGEDVFNYENGVLADTDGTWLAGRQGPGAMIMPAHPRVGDVYRPENAPGVVFEEVTVHATGRRVPGPRGQVDGAIVARELHMDGTRESKVFAPGYGEFSTGSGGDSESLALAVPTDALPGPPPPALKTLEIGALRTFDAVGAGNLTTASTRVREMTAAWGAYRPSGVPPLLEAQMNRALRALAGAVSRRRSAASRQAAIDVARAALDIQLRHRRPTEIDLGRLGLLARQLLMDARARNLAGVRGDVTTAKWTRDRVAHALGPATRRRIDTILGELQAAARTKNHAAAARGAARLRAALRGVSPVR